MENLHRLFDRRNRAAWAALLIFLALTVLAWYGLRAQAEHNAREQFEIHVRDVLDSISVRMRQHEQILLGGVGLFDASDKVQRAEWHAYVERLKLGQSYPGIQGVGFSKLIRPAELKAHIAAMHKEGFPQYTVRPPGERALYTSIVYIEPFSGRNLAVFGFDMMSEANRARAMRAAAEGNTTAITRKVKLLQETHGKEQAGFLMYLPVYRKGRPVATAEQRWEALLGYVYSPYRMDDLMGGILGNRALMLDFRIFDGETESDAARMYSSADEVRAAPARLSTSRTLDVYGNTWTVRLDSREEFEAGFHPSLHTVILILGSGISLLLFVSMSLIAFRRELEDEARLNEAQHIAKMGSWELNLKNGDLIWSDEIFRLFEIDKSKFDATYEAFLDAIHPDDRDAVNRAYANSLETRAPYEITHRLRMKDGSIKWVQERCTSDFDAEGKPLRSRGTVQDITDLRMAESAAHESAARTQAILDNVLDGIITIGERGIVESFNKSAEHIFGYAAAEVIGNNVKMLMPEPYHGQHDGYLNNFVTTGVKKIIGLGRQVVGQRKDGSTFPMDLAVSEIRLGDKRLFTGIVRDITERVKVEQMKSEFISTVSHELRTPLTSIRGSLALIAGGVVGELPAAVKPLVDIAHKNSERLILLVNDILDMEKIEAGKMEFDLQPVKLMPLLQQALDGNHAYAEQYKVHYELVSKLPDVLIKVDVNRIMQVFANLLSNAAKFSPQGGTVSVAVERVGARIRVSVKDCGPGISDEFKDRIFKKFAQADSSDTRKKGGTGLGLSITKAMVEQMGGSIGFDSEPNVQTTFYFEFPEWCEEQPRAAIMSGKISGTRVLVCEDDQDTALLLKMMLEHAGFAVDVSHDAAQAKQLLTQHDYQAMTLDLAMPVQGGLSLLRELRASPATAGLPVVVVSANAREAKNEPGSDQLGVFEWIAKPINREELTAAISRVAARVRDGRIRALYVEDDADVFQVVKGISAEVLALEQAASLDDARRMLAQQRYELVILDLTLPDGSGLELLPMLKKAKPRIPVLVFSVDELTQEDAQRVDAVLVKSRTDNARLLATIKQLVGGE